MVHGDRRPHLVALVVPDADFAREWARGADKPTKLDALVDDADFKAVLGEAGRTRQRRSCGDRTGPPFRGPCRAVSPSRTNSSHRPSRSRRHKITVRASRRAGSALHPIGRPVRPIAAARLPAQPVSLKGDPPMAEKENALIVGAGSGLSALARAAVREGGHGRRAGLPATPTSWPIWSPRPGRGPMVAMPPTRLRSHPFSNR